MSTALTETTVNRALTVANVRMNVAVNDYVVALAARNGSTTSPSIRFMQYNDLTARALGFKNAKEAARPGTALETRAKLALLRNGVAARIPAWTQRAELLGGPKCHNEIRGFAAHWSSVEALELAAVGVNGVVNITGGDEREAVHG